MASNPMDQVMITEGNLSPVIEIIALFCLIVSVLAILVRLAIKRWVLNRADLDDYFIVASGIFTVVEATVLVTSSYHGLGKQQEDVSPVDANAAFKLLYISRLFLIFSLVSSKLSLVAYLWRLSSASVDRNFSLAIGVAVILWAFTSIFLIAFQCRLPAPWMITDNSCTKLVADELYISIFSSVTEILLIVQPMIIVRRLKADLAKKAVLGGAFISRISVIIATICLAVYTTKAVQSSDLLLNIWPAIICAQVAGCLSIVTASTIYLKPFLDSLESGFINAGDLKRRQIAAYGFSPKNSSKASNGEYKYLRRVRQMSSALVTRRTDAIELEERQVAAGVLDHSGRPDEVPPAENRDWDANSRSRIIQTTTWTVTESVPDDISKERTSDSTR